MIAFILSDCPATKGAHIPLSGAVIPAWESRRIYTAALCHNISDW